MACPTVKEAAVDAKKTKIPSSSWSKTGAGHRRTNDHGTQNSGLFDSLHRSSTIWITYVCID
jgi:hypothetical protein